MVTRLPAQLPGAGQVRHQQLQRNLGVKPALLDCQVALQHPLVLLRDFRQRHSARLPQGFAHHEIGVGSHAATQLRLHHAALRQVTGQRDQTQLPLDHGDDVQRLAPFLHQLCQQPQRVAGPAVHNGVHRREDVGLLRVRHQRQERPTR